MSIYILIYRVRVQLNHVFDWYLFQQAAIIKIQAWARANVAQNDYRKLSKSLTQFVYSLVNVVILACATFIDLPILYANLCCWAFSIYARSSRQNRSKIPSFVTTQ
jgi:hypothetical protein